MIKCKHCKEEKPESEMVVRAGKPSKVCVACKENGGGSSSKKTKASTRRPKANELTLALPAGGFGVNASITEEGYLQLTQENAGAEADNICLMRHEVVALFEKFGEWAVEA